MTAKNHAVGGVVVNDESTSSVQRLGFTPDIVVASVDPLEREIEPESRTLPRYRIEIHLAAHQLDELAADRQAQSGAAELSRGRGVGLGKCTKEALLVPDRDSDARVDDLETHVTAIAVFVHEAHTHHDFSVGRELDGVRRQVEQDLLDAHGVAQQRFRHVGVHVDEELQVLIRGRRRKNPTHVIGDAFDVESDLFHLETPGFDLGEVQDVIDDGEQVLRGHLDARRQFQLVTVERRPEQQLSETDDTVHGGTNLVAHRREEL